MPWDAAFESTQILKGKVRFVLGASGHIAGVINPPAAKKRSHWVDGKLGGSAQQWLASAKEVPGSWWTDWAAWLKPHGGKMIAAPKAYGNREAQGDRTRAWPLREGKSLIHSRRAHMTTDIVIVAAARTAVGKFGGTLAKTPAADLGAAVIQELLKRAKLNGEQIGEVILGQVLTAGVGQNPARQAVIKSGLPKAVPAMTINKVCGSGLKAVMLGAQAIRDGDSEIIIAGGQENMSMSAARAAGLARRPAHGRLEDGRHDDRRRPVGRLQPVPHGHHRRERGQAIRHLARGAGRVGARLAAEGRGGAGRRQVQGRDRAVHDCAEEG